MKIAIKFGLIITLVVVAWVVFTRFLFPLSPDSPANLLAPFIFNLTAIICIYLGIRETARHSGLTFKEGLITGMSISLVYAISSCLFFLVAFLLAGQKLMASEPIAQTTPLWQMALIAFAAMFFGALVFGLFYSAIISFLLVRTRRG